MRLINELDTIDGRRKRGERIKGYNAIFGLGNWMILVPANEIGNTGGEVWVWRWEENVFSFKY